MPEDVGEPIPPVLMPNVPGILANVAAIDRLWPGDPLECLRQHLMHYRELVTALDPGCTVDDTPLHELINVIGDRIEDRALPPWWTPAPRTRAGRREADTATLKRRLAAVAAVDRLDALVRSGRHAAAMVGRALKVPAATVRDWHAAGPRDAREAAILDAFAAAFAEAPSPERVLDMLTLGIEGRDPGGG